MLYAAVGRRLGYPVRLVPALCHIIPRWDDGKIKVNLEATGPDYINCHPDDYYIDKPKPWTHREKTGGYYLRSATPREELAMMLSCRACVLAHSGRLLDAGMILGAAVRLAPADPNYPQLLGHISNDIAALPEAQRPPWCYCPELNVGFDGRRFFEPDQPLQRLIDAPNEIRLAMFAGGQVHV
jgi:hypothetical protein